MKEDERKWLRGKGWKEGGKNECVYHLSASFLFHNGCVDGLLYGEQLIACLMSSTWSVIAYITYNLMDPVTDDESPQSIIPI